MSEHHEVLQPAEGGETNEQNNIPLEEDSEMQHQEDSGTFGGPEGVEIAPGVYQCEFPSCSKRFTTKFSLKRHYYIHSRKKTFPCSFCNKVFALPQYLREHQYTHTNQQPFVCGVDGCTESFRQRGKLSLHRRTHGNFKKKDYRLLNVALNRTVRRNQSDGHSHDSSDDERHIKDEDLQTIKEEIKEDDDQPKIESGKQRSKPTDQYNRESLNNVGAQSQKDKQLLYNNDQQNPHSIQIGPIQHHPEKYQASEHLNPQKLLQANRNLVKNDNEAGPIANVSFGCNPSQMTPIYHQYSTTQQHQNVPVQFYQQYSMPNTQGHFVAPFLQSQIQEPYAIEQVATTFNPYNNSTLGGSTAITQNNQCLKEIPTHFELANESKTKCQINLRQGALENQGFPENIQSQGIESKNCQNNQMNQQRGQENVQGQNAIAFQEQIQKQTSPLQALKSQCNEGSSTSTITEPSRENHPTQPRERTPSPETVQIEHQGEPEQRGASSDGIHNPPTAANGFVAPNPLVCNQYVTNITQYNNNKFHHNLPENKPPSGSSIQLSSNIPQSGHNAEAAVNHSSHSSLPPTSTVTLNSNNFGGSIGQTGIYHFQHNQIAPQAQEQVPLKKSEIPYTPMSKPQIIQPEYYAQQVSASPFQMPKPAPVYQPYPVQYHHEYSHSESRSPLILPFPIPSNADPEYIQGVIDTTKFYERLYSHTVRYEGGPSQHEVSSCCANGSGQCYGRQHYPINNHKAYPQTKVIYHSVGQGSSHPNIGQQSPPSLQHSSLAPLVPQPRYPYPMPYQPQSQPPVTHMIHIQSLPQEQQHVVHRQPSIQIISHHPNGVRSAQEHQPSVQGKE